MAATPKPSATPVVGRKPSTVVTPVKPIVAPTPAPVVTNNDQGLMDRINNKLGNTPGYTVKVDPNAMSGIDQNDKYSDAEILALGKILKKLDYPVKKTKASVLMLFASGQYPELTELQARNKTGVDLITALTSQYLPGLDTDKPKAPDTTRQVYNYEPEQIKALIDDVYVTTLGRNATDEEKELKYAVLQKQIEQGTTTTSKVVKNASTGKMETLVTSTPAFSQEAAKTSIEEELKKANPDDFDRKSRIDFASFLTKNVAGA